MSKKVKGFLASDGKFFDTEPECQRHEHAQSIVRLCESHGINVENFFLAKGLVNIFLDFGLELVLALLG